MRTIDADALIAYLTENWIPANIDAINAQPTVTPEPHWIPCSERLPEEYGNYLITTYDGDVDIGSIDPSRKGVWSACDADGFYWLRNVIAWMPLPERYQEGANE